MDALLSAKSSTLAARLDIKFCFCATIIFFLVTSFSKQIYLFFDYSSPLGLSDLVFFEQALHNFTTDGTLETSLGGHKYKSMFGAHAFLFLLILTPFYYLFKSPLVLMLSQPLAYLLVIFVVYKILKELYKEDLQIICLVLMLLLLNPAYNVILQNFNIYGFHPEFYFPPLFLTAYYFHVKENLFLFVIFYLLSLSIIEYYSVVWITFSLYTIFVDKNPKWIDFFVFIFSVAYFTWTFLFFVPYFRGTSLPWYARTLSIQWPSLDITEIVNLAKMLGINLLFNFAIFLFLPLKNRQTLILLVPWYLVFTVAYLNGYPLPLSAGSWHGNAIYPLILLGYIKEFEKLAERQTKINVLKVGFAVAVLLFIAIQYLRPAYSSGIWPMLSKYSDLRDDYGVIQSIKDAMKDQPILVSFQLGKYFGDFKDVYLLENGSTIHNHVQYILYYSGGIPLNEQKLREISKEFRIAKEHKDLILFERLGTTRKLDANDSKLH